MARQPFLKTVREFLYGMLGYEFEEHAMELRGSLETLFMSITFGDMLGLPILERIRKETAEHGGSCREIEVDCFRLDELLAKHGIAEIDYLSIDVENAELLIVETLDFGRFPIKVIGVENAYDDYRIPLLLKKKGYRFHSKIGDEFFVREDLKQLLEDFVPNLSKLTFQFKLGSMLDKTHRISAMVPDLVDKFGLNPAQAQTARRAA